MMPSWFGNVGQPIVVGSADDWIRTFFFANGGGIITGFSIAFAVARLISPN